MKIGQRIFLCILPTLLVFAALMDMIRHESSVRTISHAVLLVPLVAILVSIAFAWGSTRYLVHMLGDTVREHQGDGDITLRAGRGSSGAEAATSAADYAMIVEEMVDFVTQRLEEVELPLHVLLSSPFGSLNENQEEMLAAAHDSVGVADSEVRVLKTLLELDRGGVRFVVQPTGLSELLRPALAVAQSRAHSVYVSICSEISEATPRVLADPVRTQEALTSILLDAVSRTSAGGEIAVNAGESETGRLRIAISHGSAAARSPASLVMRVARRIITLQQGSVSEDQWHYIVELPAERLASAQDNLPLAVVP
jgi:signal transduction histidine kinase